MNKSLVHVSWCLHCAQIYGQKMHTSLKFGVIVLLYLLQENINKCV